MKLIYLFLVKSEHPSLGKQHHTKYIATPCFCEHLCFWFARNFGPIGPIGPILLVFLNGVGLWMSLHCNVEKRNGPRTSLSSLLRTSHSNADAGLSAELALGSATIHSNLLTPTKNTLGPALRKDDTLTCHLPPTSPDKSKITK